MDNLEIPKLANAQNEAFPNSSQLSSILELLKFRTPVKLQHPQFCQGGSSIKRFIKIDLHYNSYMLQPTPIL